MRRKALPWIAGLTLIALGPMALRLAAWNETGHRVVAAIAYDLLTPKARSAVDELIRRHPDYRRIFLEDAPGEPQARARAAFLAASYWPDLIRNDDRFYDDTRRDARPTPTLAGFPDMGRHTNWHYFDTPFSTDGTPLEQQPPPHARSELERLIGVLNRWGEARNGSGPSGGWPSDAEAAYALPWLIHLVGDVHNPLHATSRFTRHQPGGDQGGNRVRVQPGGNLHSVWDSAVGDDRKRGAVDRLAEEILGEYSAKANTEQREDLEPSDWLREGYLLARSEVYGFGEGAGSEAELIVLSNTYLDNAKRIARIQAAMAGVRLAAVLNRALD